MERIKLMEKDKKITPEYVNKKMEHMLTAIYDVIEENEHRMRTVSYTHLTLPTSDLV